MSMTTIRHRGIALGSACHRERVQSGRCIIRAGKWRTVVTARRFSSTLYAASRSNVIVICNLSSTVLVPFENDVSDSYEYIKTRGVKLLTDSVQSA